MSYTDPIKEIIDSLEIALFQGRQASSDSECAPRTARLRRAADKAHKFLSSLSEEKGYVKVPKDRIVALQNAWATEPGGTHPHRVNAVFSALAPMLVETHQQQSRPALRVEQEEPQDHNDWFGLQREQYEKVLDAIRQGTVTSDGETSIMSAFYCYFSWIVQNPKPQQEEPQSPPVLFTDEHPETLEKGEWTYRLERRGFWHEVLTPSCFKATDIIRSPNGAIFMLSEGPSPEEMGVRYGMMRAGCALYRRREKPTPQAIEWLAATDVDGWLDYGDARPELPAGTKGKLVFIPEGATYDTTRVVEENKTEVE